MDWLEERVMSMVEDPSSATFCVTESIAAEESSLPLTLMRKVLLSREPRSSSEKLRVRVCPSVEVEEEVT